MNGKLEKILGSFDGAILFEDNEIICIDKPPNPLVLPDRYDKNLPNLYGILRHEFGEVFVVHRIDKETSGVILFAKSAEAHAFVNKEFESRSVEKVYLAVVQGRASQREGTIDLPLSEDEKSHRMKVDRKDGKESVTHYRVTEQFRDYAFVEARPKTGRMHQLRVHLSAVGLPILADSVYGISKAFYLSGVKPNYKAKEEEKPLLNRTALHASSLSFSHPRSKQRLTVEAPLPKDVQSVLKYLRKFRALGTA